MKSIGQVEDELNSLLDRRAREVKEDRAGQQRANALEAMWAASDRAQAAKQREENRRDWAAYYRRLAASSLAAARDYRRRARRLEEARNA